MISAIFRFIFCSILNDYHIEGFTIKRNILIHKEVPMAELIRIEFALNDNKFIRELTYTLLLGSDNSLVNNSFFSQKTPGL